MLGFLFWILILATLYSYVIYPIILWLIVRVQVAGSEVDSMSNPGFSFLKVSIIITVHNEQARIRTKLEQTLKLRYPNDLLEIIIASDGSTDETDTIVSEFKGSRVTLVAVRERKGKEHAQLQAIEVSSGDIIIFSDVATSIEVDALVMLVGYFADPRIGAVSSEDRFISNDGQVQGEGVYVRYEMALRRLESRMAGLVGMSGSFFAARKEVCKNWDILSPSDFNTALNCARLGLKAVHAPDVFGFYKNIVDEKKEYQRKLRTVIRGMTATARHRELLNPIRYGLFAWQLLSHKLMRWMVPWFLLAMMLVNSLLLDQGIIYELIFVLQATIYTLVTAAWGSLRMRQNRFIKVPYFFIQVNIAIAHAMLAFLSGRRVTVWSPSVR